MPSFLDEMLFCLWFESATAGRHKCFQIYRIYPYSKTRIVPDIECIFSAGLCLVQQRKFRLCFCLKMRLRKYDFSLLFIQISISGLTFISGLSSSLAMT